MTKDELSEQLDDLVEMIENLAEEAGDMGMPDVRSWLQSAEDCLNRALAATDERNDDF